MTSEIKQRIEQIRRGEVPEEYKKIHGDIVPLTWDQISLADCIVPYEEKTSVANQYPVLTSSRKGLMLQTDYYSNRQVTTEDNVGYNIIPFGYSCHLHFSNSDRNYVKNALDRLVELNLLHFNPQEVQHIKDVIDLRNRVHIRLTNGNELSNADFNRDIYNDAVNLLKTVDEQIYQYAVPLYGCGHTIPISREP